MNTFLFSPSPVPFSGFPPQLWPKRMGCSRSFAKRWEAGVLCIPSHTRHTYTRLGQKCSFCKKKCTFCLFKNLCVVALFLHFFAPYARCAVKYFSRISYVINNQYNKVISEPLHHLHSFIPFFLVTLMFVVGKKLESLPMQFPLLSLVLVGNLRFNFQPCPLLSPSYLKSGP